jgi:hypothetical protein
MHMHAPRHGAGMPQKSRPASPGSALRTARYRPRQPHARVHGALHTGLVLKPGVLPRIGAGMGIEAHKKAGAGLGGEEGQGVGKPHDIDVADEDLGVPAQSKEVGQWAQVAGGGRRCSCW